jgi:uracil-DNA glycosylase
VVALGATALRSLTGRTTAIVKLRGRAVPLADGTPLIATIHPSYLLRIRDDNDKAAEYSRFVNDLRLCARLLEKVA